MENDGTIVISTPDRNRIAPAPGGIRSGNAAISPFHAGATGNPAIPGADRIRYGMRARIGYVSCRCRCG